MEFKNHNQFEDDREANESLTDTLDTRNEPFVAEENTVLDYAPAEKVAEMEKMVQERIVDSKATRFETDVALGTAEKLAALAEKNRQNEALLESMTSDEQLAHTLEQIRLSDEKLDDIVEHKDAWYAKILGQGTVKSATEIMNRLHGIRKNIAAKRNSHTTDLPEVR